MSITWFEQGLEKGIEQGIEKGIEQGIEKGIEKGYRELLREQLEERFGPLPSAVLERLQQLPRERLSALARALVHAQSLHELGLDE